MNRVRARTTSPEPNRRFLYVALALLIVNVWTYLKWVHLRVGKQVHHRLFPLSKMIRFLNRAVEVACGLQVSVSLQL